MLFEMLTGRPPFDDTDPLALVHAHITLEPPDPGELRRGGPAAWPAAVSAVVGKLLAKAAEERYQSGLGLAYDLERCLAELDANGADSSRGARSFQLGERDVPERFELPQTLVGRDAELGWLEEALEESVAARRPVVRLVAGYSGVGKTALVEEIRYSVLRRQGLFAGSGFNPSSGATPYGGVLEALHGLTVQKLGEKPERAAAWAERLTHELGTNLGVLTDAVPALLALIGEPPAVPVVETANAKNRFFDCIKRFLATLSPRTDGGAPLVVFLDDLQWIGPASLQLLRTAPAGSAAGMPDRLLELERLHVRRILEACDWKVKGEGNAADRLGLTPPTLRNRMKKLGIERPA